MRKKDLPMRRLASALSVITLCAALPSVALAQVSGADAQAAASVAALNAGQADAGLAAAKQSFENAETPAQKYVAARLAARSYSTMGQDTRAQVWLRVARENAPDEAEAQSVAEDYKFLRNRNPLSVSLSFGVTPSSNVNNGSAAETSDLFGLGLPFTLNPEARALSGMSYNIGADLSYRVARSARAETYVTAGIDATTYTLSQTARDALAESAPDVKGSDYSNVDLTVGLIHRRILSDGMQPTTFSLEAGKVWYGGDAYSTSIAMGANQAFDLNEKNRIQVSVNTQKRMIESSGDDVVSTSLGATWLHAFDGGSIGGLFGQVTRSNSDDGDQDYAGHMVGVSYAPANAIMGMDLSFSMSREVRGYDNSTLANGARTDTTFTAQASAVLTTIEYYGFQPVVSVAARTTNSTLDLFNREGVDVGFNLRSSF
jgi:hypothetical protein